MDKRENKQWNWLVNDKIEGARKNVYMLCLLSIPEGMLYYESICRRSQKYMMRWLYETSPSSDQSFSTTQTISEYSQKLT